MIKPIDDRVFLFCVEFYRMDLRFHHSIQKKVIREALTCRHKNYNINIKIENK